MKAFLVSLIFTVTALADFAIIANPNISINNISKSELEKIFLSKTRNFADGTRAKPVEIAKTGLKSMFYNLIANKSEVELRSYWATLIFTGTGKPPKQMKNEDQVIKYVSQTPGAISYIEKREPDESVKIIFLSEK